MPEFVCDLSASPRQLKHAWEHTVGSGHAPLALRADWQAQLRRSHQELGVRHVRFHAILSDQMGTLICQNNEFLYSFFNIDQIFDYLLSIGMRPFVELSFMPETLASGSKIVFRYRANVTPPKNYHDWATLIHKLAKHLVERYGAKEVGEWFFEVWNEPNLEAFWTGKKEDYFELYRHTAEALKGVDASLRVGGPVTAQNAWIPDFLDFCEKNKLPADFISTHYYPTDAFGKIGADTLTQLEHAPRNVMREKAQETKEQARGRPIYYTEWNISSNPRDPLHDEPFAAAFATNIVMKVDEFIEGYSFWTFSDIFEENYMPSIPFQGGFGLLNLQGIAKPVYRAFQLLHQLGTEVFEIKGEHETVSAWVVKKGEAVTVLLTNHAMPRHPINTEIVKIELTNINQPRRVFLERIDETHANPVALWREMNQPKYLSATEVEQLQAASQVVKEIYPCRYENRAAHLEVALPPHAIAAITLELA